MKQSKITDPHKFSYDCSWNTRYRVHQSLCLWSKGADILNPKHQRPISNNVSTAGLCLGFLFEIWISYQPTKNFFLRVLGALWRERLAPQSESANRGSVFGPPEQRFMVMFQPSWSAYLR